MRLDGKVALICGASGKAGRAVALLFVQEGAKVGLVTRNADSVTELANQLNSAGEAAAIVVADPTTDAGARRAVERTVRAFGKLDVVFYGVGYFKGGDIRPAETTEADWDSLMEANLKGAFLVARHAIPELMRAGGGSIIVVSASLGARRAGNVGYSVAKSAVLALTEKLAREYRAENVRVNAILPRLIGSPLDPRGVAPPGGRVTDSGRPEDVAYAALYLASDEARLVSGAAIPLDGAADL